MNKLVIAKDGSLVLESELKAYNAKLENKVSDPEDEIKPSEENKVSDENKAVTGVQPNKINDKLTK